MDYNKCIYNIKFYLKVPNVSCPELDIPNPSTMASQQDGDQVNQSVAGGLVTSAAAGIASLWRGWAANR